jgi:hypothetical protein
MADETEVEGEDPSTSGSSNENGNSHLVKTAYLASRIKF